MIRITYKKQSYPRFSAQDVQTILRKNGDKKLPWNKEPQVEKSKDPMAIELARRLAKGLPDNPLEMDIQERYINYFESASIINIEYVSQEHGCRKGSS